MRFMTVRAIFWCILAAAPVAAQDTARAPAFNAFSGASDTAYTFNLARLFYATPGVAATDRHQLLTRMTDFARVMPAQVNSANELYVALRASDSLQGDRKSVV